MRLHPAPPAPLSQRSARICGRFLVVWAGTVEVGVGGGRAKGVRATRGWEGREPRGGFYYANKRAGFISASAAGLRGWEGMPGSGGQPKAGTNPCQLSFLFLIHSQGGHTGPPLPPEGGKCFSAQPCPYPGSLGGVRTQESGRSATGGGQAAGAGEHPQPRTSVRGCWPDAKLGVPREGKRTLHEAFIPTENPSPSPQNQPPGQSSP